MSNSITSASAPRQPQELTPVALPRTQEAAPVKDAPKVRMPEAAEVKPDHKDLRRNLDEALQRCTRGRLGCPSAHVRGPALASALVANRRRGLR